MARSHRTRPVSTASAPAAAPAFDIAAELRALCDAIHPEPDLRRSSDQVLAMLARSTGAARASLMVVDPSCARLRIVAGIGIPEEFVGHPMPPRPRSISEWVARHRRGLILNGEIQDQRFEGCAARGGIESALCVPLVGARGVCGVLNLARQTPAPVFEEHDLARIAALAEPLAAALERLLRAQRAERALGQLDAGAANGHALLAPGVTPVHDYDLGLGFVPGTRRGADLWERAAHDAGSNSLLVADVPGDGVAAAVTAAFVHGLFVAGASSRRTISGLLSQLNAELHVRFGGARSVALWVTRLGPHGEITSCNAGYPAPFWVPSDGGPIQRLDSGGPLAGALAHRAYDEEQVRLLPGDLIVAVSNGLLDVEDSAGRAFGDARIAELLEARRREALDRIGAALCAAALDFGGRPSPADDFAVLAVRYSPGA